MSARDANAEWKEEVLSHHMDRYLAMESRDSFRVKFMPHQKGDSLSETACWFPLVPNGADGSACTSQTLPLAEPSRRNPLLHVLTIGEGITQRLLPGKAKQTADYAKSYYEHELGHARHTEPRRDLIHGALDTHQIPFQLYNVFEDARIEDLRRKELSKSGETYAFKWDQFEKPNELKDPGQIFWAFIFHEGDRSKLDARLPPTAKPELVDDVEQFYKRAVDAPGSREVIAVAAEFAKKYGKDSSGSGSGDASGQQAPTSGFSETFELNSDIEAGARNSQVAGTGMPGKPRSRSGSSASQATSYGDMQVADQVASDPKALAQLLAQPKPTAIVDPAFKDFVTLAKKNEPHFFEDAPNLGTLQEDAVARLSSLLTPPKSAGSTFVSDRPSRTFDRSRFARDLDNFYVHRDEEERARLPSILLVADCSSSMHGKGLPLSRHLIAAFSDLAQKKKLSGTVLLSGIYREKQSYEPTYYRMPLPMDRSRIHRLKARGNGEGLQPTLNANRDLVVSSDHVVVITDGSITDSAIDRQLFRNAGKTAIGAFLGDNDQTEQLKKHFDVALAAPTQEELAVLIQKALSARGPKPR